MIDELSNDQAYILYQLEKWHTHRTSQNIFIDYRSWSGIFQTLSMYANYADLSLKEILFLTPIQIDAVTLSRSGLWAESIEEFVYCGYSIEEDFSEVLNDSSIDFNNIRRRRSSILLRQEDQKTPKLVIILNAERITEKILSDTNKLIHAQTIVCMDTARYCSDDSIIYRVKKPISHIFLNEDVDPIQKFLYDIMEKRLVPLSREKSVRVIEYTKGPLDLSKYTKPIFSCSEDHIDRSSKIMKGSLVYSDNYQWSYSLEPDRYHLIKGIFMIVDVISNRFGVQRITCHPTYTKFKYKTVQNLKLKLVGCPCFVGENLPPWKFRTGSLIVPKVLKSMDDARRIYNGMNLFDSSVTLVIV